MQKRTEIIPAIAHFILRASNHSVDYVVNEIRPAPLPNSERGREGRVFAYSIFAMFECCFLLAGAIMHAMQADLQRRWQPAVVPRSHLILNGKVPR